MPRFSPATACWLGVLASCAPPAPPPPAGAPATAPSAGAQLKEVALDAAAEAKARAGDAVDALQDGRARKAAEDAAAEVKAKAGQAVDSAKETAASISARANLKRVGKAIFAENDPTLSYPTAAITDKTGKPLLSWRVTILPRIGEGELFAQFKQDEAWDGPNNQKLIARMPKVYADPRPEAAGAGEGKTYLKAFVGKDALLDGGRPQTVQGVTDSTSMTLFGAVGGEPVVWTKPDDIAVDLAKPLPDLSKPFPDLLLLMADGATYSVPSSVWREKQAVIQKAITPAAGDTWNREELHPNVELR